MFQNKASECRSETNNPGNIGNLSNAAVNTKKRDYNRNDTKAKKTNASCTLWSLGSCRRGFICAMV